MDLSVCFRSDFGVREGLDPGFQRPIRWDVPLLGGYRHQFLKGASLKRSFKVACAQAIEIAQLLLSGQFDALWVHGYNRIDLVPTIALARRLNVPVFIRDEATLADRRSLGRRMTKRVLIPKLLQRVYALYIGKLNRQFFEHYGATGDRLFFTPYSVDNDFFQLQAAQLVGMRSQLRRRFGIREDGPVVLFCGKLIDKKAPLTLLRAFARVRAGSACTLLFAGDGPLRRAIDRASADERIPDVCVTGFLNQSEISAAYAVADIFVLPSVVRETWGLVVNEAMNFGLPIIVSDKVGCGPDLVRPNVNGFIVPSQDEYGLSVAIREMSSDPEKARRFGARSRQIIADWTVGATATGIVNAISTVLGDAPTVSDGVPLDEVARSG